MFQNLEFPECTYVSGSEQSLWHDTEWEMIRKDDVIDMFGMIHLSQIVWNVEPAKVNDDANVENKPFKIYKAGNGE